MPDYDRNAIHEDRHIPTLTYYEDGDRYGWHCSCGTEGDHLHYSPANDEWKRAYWQHVARAATDEVAALREANIEWKRQVVEKHREVDALREALKEAQLANTEWARECDALRAERDHYREALDKQVAWRQREEVRAITAEAERDAMRAVVDAFEDVCLDHGCGLEGYDDACCECRAVKAMDAYRESINKENT